MDTMKAFGMGMMNRGKSLMVFDWDKAAKLIKENKPNSASAGLSGDWEYTGGNIYENNSPINREDTYVFLASTWATPELDLDGDILDCYIMEENVPESWVLEFGNNYSGIYWPKSSLDILNN
jgi:hypothetical protein